MAISKIPTISMVKRIEKNGNVSLYTCDHTWEPEHYNEEGKLVKGRSRATNHKKVGNVLNPVNNSGWVQFYDFVYKDYPELKDYLVYRQDSKTLYFHKSEILIDGKEQHVLPGLPEGVTLPESFTHQSYNDGYTSVLSKSVPSSSHGSMTADPADAFLALAKDYELSKTNHISKFRATATKRAGASHLIHHVAKKTQLKFALDKALGHKRANKLLALATRVIIENDFKIEGMNEFLLQNDVVNQNGLSDNSFYHAINTISKDDRNTFFSEFIKSAKNNNLITKNGDGYILHLDGTNIKNSNEDLNYVVQGKHKDGNFGAQVSLQVLCDQEGLPLYYVLGNGNCNDVSMVPRTITEASAIGFLGEITPVLCGDRGYGCNSVVDTLLQSNHGFILNWKTSASYGKTAMEIAVENGIKKRGNFVFNKELDKIFGYYRLDVMHDYCSTPVKDKRKVKDSRAALVCHVFFDPDIEAEHEKSVLKRIRTAFSQLQSGVPLEKSDKQTLKLLTNYDETKHIPGSDECFLLKIDNNKFEAQKQKWGIQVLVTSEVNMSYKDVYEIYHSRTPIETCNQRLKAFLNASHLNAKSDKAVENRAFLLFLATIITSYISDVIKKNRKQCTKGIPRYLDSVPALLRIANNVMVDIYDKPNFKGKFYHEIVGEAREIFLMFGLKINDDYVSITRNRTPMRKAT